MKHLAFVTLLILSLALIVFPQTPTLTPPNNDDAVVKISTTLIQIDATVTDKKGSIIRDLKPEDFEVYENGKRQDITNFSFISPAFANQPTTSTQALKENAKSNIPLPPIKLKPEQVRRTYAIVVDDLGLSFSSIFWVKDALKKFVNDQMQEGDLVAILRVGTGLGALQSFTSDKRQLLAAIEKIRWNTLANPYSYKPIKPDLDDEQPGEVTPEQLAQRAAKNAQAEAFDLKTEIDRQANVATGTLGALNYIIGGMSNLPGRKSIMFFSEGFKTMDRSQKIPQTTKVLDGLRVVAESATRASVVLYTFDPRGIYAPGALAEDDIVGLKGQGAGNSQEIRDRETTVTESIDTLRYLANETGGIAYLGNNLNGGIKKVFNDQTGYYLLGYQPDSETFDPKKNNFNKLELRIKNPDLKIRYRSGFYGITNENLKQTTRNSQKIYTALSSPFAADDINLNLYSVFYNDFQDRNYIRALVHIDAKDLTFTVEPDGVYRTNFEVIASVFDTNGISANNGVTPITLRFSKENFQRVQKEGVIYNLETPIIVTGGYQFRIALRDPATDKVGSASQFIEVPNLNKKNLTLSQLIVRNYTLAKWNELISGKNVNFDNEKKLILTNTALREFKRGSVISYYYVIYNTKFDSRMSPKLQIQTRLFHNGKVILENEPEPLNIGNQKDLKRIEASNAVTLGTDLAMGDYIMQIIVFDKNADKKKQIATQWIDFEVVE
jgi:VWFA-related protein